MNNVLVAPSVLSADFSKLKSELDSIANADYIHYDVMDGHFVPNISFGPDIFSYCKKSSELPIDVHLMVTNPAEIAPLFLDRGADVVTTRPKSMLIALFTLSRIPVLKLVFHFVQELL